MRSRREGEPGSKAKEVVLPHYKQAYRQDNMASRYVQVVLALLVCLISVQVLDTYQVVLALLVCLISVHSCSFTGPLTATASGFSLSTCMQLVGR